MVGGPLLLLPADRDIDRSCCPSLPLFLDGLLDGCLPFLLLRSLDFDRRFLPRLLGRDLEPDDDLVPLDLWSVTLDPLSVLGSEVTSLESVSTSCHIGLAGGGGATNEGSLACLWGIWEVENAGRFGRSNGWLPCEPLKDSECTVSTEKLLFLFAPIDGRCCGSCSTWKLRGCDFLVPLLAPRAKPLLSLFLVDLLLTLSAPFLLLRLLLLLEGLLPAPSELLVEALAWSLVSMPPTRMLPDISSSGSA